MLALIYMARHNHGRFVKIEHICSEYDISKKYLELLLTSLKQNGYLRTKRGSAGGYALAKPPDQITFAEIIRLMDGALAPTESVSKYFYSHTPVEKEKTLLSVFADIREYISTKLENVTLADLV